MVLLSIGSIQANRNRIYQSFQKGSDIPAIDQISKAVGIDPDRLRLAFFYEPGHL